MGRANASANANASSDHKVEGKRKKSSKEGKEKKRHKVSSHEKGERAKKEDGGTEEKVKRAKANASEGERAANASDAYATFASTPFEDGVKRDLISMFDAPSAIQRAAWGAACAGLDVVAVAKTGSGKTLAFLLPMFHRIERARDHVQGLVVAPTRELAIQIHAECDKFGTKHGFQSACVYGGASSNDQRAALRVRKPCIVIGTPGRLVDLMSQSGVLSLSALKVIVLDEADRMLDMGFEPQIKTIFGDCPVERQTLLFSATWPKAVRKLAAGYLRDKSLVREIFVGEGEVDGELAANKAISQRFIQARDHEKDEKLYNLICEFPDESRVVVFANTKRRVENLSKTFSAEGFGTVSVHGDKTQADREASLRKFVANQCPLMMATDVAARGLDIKGVTHVVNYDMARDVESYVHRIGRTGRAGELGAAVTFWNPDYDIACTPALCKIARDANQPVPDWLAKYEKTKESKQWKTADAKL